MPMRREENREPSQNFSKERRREIQPRGETEGLLVIARGSVGQRPFSPQREEHGRGGLK